MTNKLYKQCELRNGNLVEIAWVPIEFAKAGKYLEIKKQGNWESGWQVAAVYTVLDLEDLNNIRDSQRHFEDKLDGAPTVKIIDYFKMTIIE